MNEIQLLEYVEQYLKGEMSPDQAYQFEHLRKTNPELDQLFVEQAMFYQQLGQFTDWKRYTAQLQDIHQQLADAGTLPTQPARRIWLQSWKKYQKVTAVAASIAGITTLLIALTVSYYAQRQNDEQLQQLRMEFRKEVNTKKQEVLKEVDNKIRISKAPENSAPKSGGTGFLIDGKGYLVTNAHVVNGASSIIVLNNKGEEFRANLLYLNASTDIALLKVQDTDFKNVRSLPYSFRRKSADLGDRIFTLGYPKNEIVYNEGYMSAKTGYQGDPLSFQIGLAANPGNSGGPLFNENGEIIGIINTRLLQAEGVVFAINSTNIFRAVEEVRQQYPDQKKLNLSLQNSLTGLNRSQQIRKIQDYVYMVKSY